MDRSEVLGMPYQSTCCIDGLSTVLPCLYYCTTACTTGSRCPTPPMASSEPLAWEQTSDSGDALKGIGNVTQRVDCIWWCRWSSVYAAGTLLGLPSLITSSATSMPTTDASAGTGLKRPAGGGCHLDLMSLHQWLAQRLH